MRSFPNWREYHRANKESEPQPADIPEDVSMPALDIHETPEGLVLEADLPGVPPDKLDVRVEDNVLTIYGKVVWPVPDGARLLHEEVPAGNFYRSFILSDEVDVERITADFSQGVLRLTLPKAAKASPRRIDVRTTSSNAGSKDGA
jgi:HSP20 family molecular chaperone IbpA